MGRNATRAPLGATDFDPAFRWRTALAWWLVAAVVIAGFSVWTEANPKSIRPWCVEDGVVETATAVLCLLAAVGLVVVLFRSRFLRGRNTRWAYVMTAAWAVLMVIFFGEEISWGQRIFGFETPEGLSSRNLQDEFTFHNIDVVDTFIGGKYRYLSFMMLTTGLLVPLAAQWRPTRRILRFFAYPAAPLAYAGFFVGAYVYGKVYDPVLQSDASEVREFVMALGLFCFAAHGAWRADQLFRFRPPSPPEGVPTPPAS